MTTPSGRQSPPAEAGGERLHRPRLVRTGPHRNVALMWSGGGASRAEEPDATAPEAATVAGTVEHGVRTAYEVLARYMKDGREVASLLSPWTTTDWGGAGMGRNGQDPGRRAMDMWADMAQRWVELWGAMMPLGGPEMVRSFRSFWAAGDEPDDDDGGDVNDSDVEAAAGTKAKRGGRASGGEPEDRATYSVEVRSVKRAAVTLHVPSHAVSKPLEALPLTSLGNQKDTLAVSLSEKSRGHLLVAVKVPEGQPAGTYAGVVVDRKANTPCGYVTVVVSDD
jgi:hypothetical protein